MEKIAKNIPQTGTTYFIAIDKRERDILSVFDKYPNSSDINGNPIGWRAEHLTTGDFIIFCGTQAILIIERKTWSDLAASFRDGRKHNINKLLQYRQLTGAKIAYLIEGTAFPASNAKFARIPYVNLRAHLDHLLFRDNIIELRTASLIGTVERLFQLVKNISSIKFMPAVSIEPIAATSIEPIAAASIEPIATASIEPMAASIEPIDANILSIAMGGKTNLELAQIPQQLNDTQIIEKLWKCLPQINDVNAKLFRNYHISDLLMAKLSCEQIANFSYQNGIRVGMTRAKKIYAISNMELKSNAKYYVKLLSTVPGISRTTAIRILAAYPISKILREWTDIKAELRCFNRGKKRLGNKIIANIEKYLITPHDE